MSDLPSPEEVQQMRIDTLKVFCPSAIPYVTYAQRAGEPVQERLFNWREGFQHVLNMLIHTDQALQSLTPGGSEYVHAPDRCVALVKEQQTALHQAQVDNARLRGLLMSARRYAEGYNENENNHPQARDGARSLVADINSALAK